MYRLLKCTFASGRGKSECSFHTLLHLCSEVTWFLELWCLSVLWDTLIHCDELSSALLFLPSVTNGFFSLSSTQGQWVLVTWAEFTSLCYPLGIKGQLWLPVRWADHFIIARFLSCDVELFVFYLFYSPCWIWLLFFPTDSAQYVREPYSPLWFMMMDHRV